MHQLSQSLIQSKFAEADATTNSDHKGRLLEEIACHMFEAVSGVTVMGRDTVSRQQSSEIDITFWNDRERNGLYFLPWLFLVECKNKATAMDSKEVRFFVDHLEDKGQEWGIIVSSKGITGDASERNAAYNHLAGALKKRIRVLIFSRTDIEGLTSADELVTMMKRKISLLTLDQQQYSD